ncbi:serine hydrolase domain-containing protein [Congregibacter litoralis]|uniref:Beta-lactamase class C and other penicillin binding protein n=1 Tax=Congregibacter litoralis KT71 TaxID=314285 RepID=A4AC46_9GAMM|nr:serine hydrolase [Congregibacter litoralis]EAQ96496.1 Beta-lactamase class C and other penicillin binding protein [Congregibacter litoralis KT71]
MKKIIPVLSLGLLLTLLFGVWTARDAMKVAVGYSAKQVCSGVFLSGLSAEFVQDRDVNPNMAILGPLLGALDITVDQEQGLVSASLLGVDAQAVHLSGRGCTLNGPGEGAPPLSVAAADESGPGVPAPWRPAVEAAFAEPEASTGARNTYALLVARQGELLLEAYASPITAGTRLQGWSMNKSLMATWIGMQTERGLIDPAQPLAVLLADDPKRPDLDPTLTLLHLLQMESGLDFVEVYGPGSDVTKMLYTAPAMWEIPAGKPQAYPPGEHFSYSSGDTVFASYLWQKTLKEPFEAWIAREFTAPLGMNSLVAEADASGVQVGSSYVYLTARDWLKAGQLWLDAWHGRSELLSQRWLRDSVTARPSDEKGRYGRGFWLNTDGVVFEGLPENLFYAGGHAGQFVVVIPEWETVVVRLGLTGAGVDKGMHEFLLSLAKLRSPAF